ncbi:MAG TPA: AraD1 family protein [Rhizomicrobium sp.]|nr:AraD1 family protein [Rhizomicrobium sp.]
MTLRLIQMTDAEGRRIVAAATEGTKARRVKGVASTHALANAAIAAKAGLAGVVADAGYGEDIDIADALHEGRILAPIDHPDSARMFLTGTGLTHLGSADARDKMHAKAHSADASDSMKMFRMGLEGGKPPPGEAGVQPEWFYKGDGRSIVAPEQPLPSPDFARDGGEEPELAGIYLIGAEGAPFRLGFTLANEFSDHVTERTNYLYLAHSKLRPASLGPELFVGELPEDIRGTARIRRDGRPIWEKPFLTGEANMSHRIANLEHHHFKYTLFRRPGDLHVHFFGTATLSFSDGIKAQDGDVFEIEAPPFSLPLRNPLKTVPSPDTGVRRL